MKTKTFTRAGMYRSRDGVIFGVTQGLADRFDLSANWLRLLWLVFLVFSGVFPTIAVYLILALVMKIEPVLKPESPAEEEFYRSYTASGSLGLARLKEKFDTLEARTRRMENHVTNRSYDWDRRMNTE